MAKILSYDNAVNEVRDVEFLCQDGTSYSLKVRKINDKILIEVIADSQGRITTAADFVRGTKLPLEEIRERIYLAFSASK